MKLLNVSAYRITIIVTTLPTYEWTKLYIPFTTLYTKDNLNLHLKEPND